MAIIFLAFGRTPSVITKKVHVRNYFKTDDVQIVFYNDLNICRYIFLNLSTNKKYSSIHPWDFPKILINKIEKKYQIHPQYIISGLWDAGNRKRIAKIYLSDTKMVWFIKITITAFSYGWSVRKKIILRCFKII